MLVHFTSTATGSLTMFSEAAVPLIKLMGATGNVPGAISGKEIPAALQRLKQQLRENVPNASKPHDRDERETQGEDDDECETPVSLALRGVPLIAMLERAASKEAAVMWDYA